MNYVLNPKLILLIIAAVLSNIFTGDCCAQTTQATIARGRSAFQSSCTQCHDAQRSLEKRKSFSSWTSTVRRMAALDDANVTPADVIPIASYLASLSQPSRRPRRASQAPRPTPPTDDSSEETSKDDVDQGERAGSERASTDKIESTDSPSEDDDTEMNLLASVANESALSLSGTVSAIWLGGNDNLENPGFFPDAWVRADWQSGSALRGRVTGCTSCHADQSGDDGFTFELVEAVAAYDLTHKLNKRRACREAIRVDAEVKAGRFVVPFGAFASRSHPGIYRTVTNPLMYNMGRQVNADGARPPVLPMPYSDEGVDFNAKITKGKFRSTVDFYAVNGLQGTGPGINFTTSRDYTDNNSETAIGGRATVGWGTIRFGGSLMSGRMQDDGRDPLNYHFTGADATAKFFDNDLRLSFEYAIRRNDSTFGERQIVYGTVSEVEALLFGKPNLSLLGRYDTIEHHDAFADAAIRRFTWGLSSTLLGGSNLIVNHEHWRFSGSDPDTDLLGVRWVATF